MKYPRGKLNKDDLGETAIAIAADRLKQVIILEFPNPTKWIGLNPSSARELIQILESNLKKLLPENRNSKETE